MIPSDWQQLGAIVAILVVLGGIGMTLIRAKLRGEFVPHVEHAALARRIGEVEMRQVHAPSSTDITALSGRIAGVETGVAVAQATLTGVADSSRRTEHMVNLLLEHQLGKDKT